MLGDQDCPASAPTFPGLLDPLAVGGSARGLSQSDYKTLGSKAEQLHDPLQPLAHQIQAIELLSAKPVVALAINHENLPDNQIPLICEAIKIAIGLPAFDVLRDGPEELVNILIPHLRKNPA